METKKGAEITYNIKYLTDYGEVSFSQKLEFIDIHNQIYLNWKWDYLWPGYSPERKIITEFRELEVLPGQRSRQRGKGEKVYIITRHIQWPATLDKLAEVVEMSGGIEIGDRLRWVIPDDFPIDFEKF